MLIDIASMNRFFGLLVVLGLTGSTAALMACLAIFKSLIGSLPWERPSHPSGTTHEENIQYKQKPMKRIKPSFISL